MQRTYYSNKIGIFAQQNPDEILGIIARANTFALEQNQRNAWLYQINLLQNSLRFITDGDIAFEYTIPRIGTRIDNVVSYNGILYIIEFKVGESSYPQYAIDQVMDYALDLKYFHKESENRIIVPIIICTNAPEFQNTYPIVITRNLAVAKKWVIEKARGTERYGLTASSEAKRLRSFGIWVQSDINAENWFLNGKDDIRSSYFLEETATEFSIQGLEIDWSIVAWDGDYRIENNTFVPYSFKGTKWNLVRNNDDQLYRKNTYRVLLTRARQGFIIFIPQGDDKDATRQCEFYDSTYNYLKRIGIVEI